MSSLKMDATSSSRAGRIGVSLNAELISFEKSLRESLIAIDEPRFSKYPHLDLSSEDVGVLDRVERATSQDLRRRFGFLRWYLLARRTSAQSTYAG
jgi:hypothetical protein